MRAIPRQQLPQNRANMEPSGSSGNVQGRADFQVRMASCQQAQNVHLTLRQCLQPAVWKARRDARGCKFACGYTDAAKCVNVRDELGRCARDGEYGICTSFEDRYPLSGDQAAVKHQ